MRGQISNFHQVGEDRGKGNVHAAYKNNLKKRLTKDRRKIELATCPFLTNLWLY